MDMARLYELEARRDRLSDDLRDLNIKIREEKEALAASLGIEVGALVKVTRRGEVVDGRIAKVNTQYWHPQVSNKPSVDCNFKNKNGKWGLRALYVNSANYEVIDDGGSK